MLVRLLGRHRRTVPALLGNTRIAPQFRREKLPAVFLIFPEPRFFRVVRPRDF
jgi:hypothetical protein